MRIPLSAMIGLTLTGLYFFAAILHPGSPRMAWPKP